MAGLVPSDLSLDMWTFKEGLKQVSVSLTKDTALPLENCHNYFFANGLNFVNSKVQGRLIRGKNNDANFGMAHWAIKQ